MVSAETLGQFLVLLPTYYNPLALTFVPTTNHLHAHFAHRKATYYLTRRPTYRTHPLHDMFVESPNILPIHLQDLSLQGQLLSRYYPFYTPRRLHPLWNTLSR